MSGKIFFVVGHSNWGKSKTLKALTTHHQVRYFQIGGVDFFIRRMSNDDYLGEWAELVKGLRPSERPYVIVALCPNDDALKLLEQLRSRYELFFWVLRHSYQDDRSISRKEEASLRTLGTVEVFEERLSAERRAAQFKKFVATYI